MVAALAVTGATGAVLRVSQRERGEAVPAAGRFALAPAAADASFEVTRPPRHRDHHHAEPPRTLTVRSCPSTELTRALSALADYE